MKRAYIFPGQGAQTIGMGKSLYEISPKAREMMEEANDILGFRITDIMFDGPEEDLRATRAAQPALFLHSVCAAACTEGLPSPDMVAGHSLGEFSALVAAGSLSFQDGLRLVAARANAMQKCCETVPGTMAAIISLSEDIIERICSEIGGVVPANYNSDGQVVISGTAEAVEKACTLMKEAGARRALPLGVSGAFHSPLMEPAREELSAAINATHFSAPICPVYQNVSAAPETNPESIKANLLQQLTSPVRWTQSAKAMLADGATDFTEFGPGTVLQGLIKRIAAASSSEVELRGIQ